MSTLAIIAGMALTTYACRALPLLLMTDPARLPLWVRRWLEYLPPALLAAMVAQQVAAPGEGTAVLRWIPAGLCLVVAALTRKLVPALLAGLAGRAVVLLLVGL